MQSHFTSTVTRANPPGENGMLGPIGILTRDRVGCLDVTLRSLSLTGLPEHVSVTIYDDASREDETLRYYQSNERIEVPSEFRMTKKWRDAGLEVVNHTWMQPTGIRGLISIRRLADTSLGVMNASCRAICHLFERHPAANGVFLLQDDVVFKENWYHRMLATIDRAGEFTQRPLGVLAGLKINKKLDVPASTVAVKCGITAQCLYISRNYFRVAGDFFQVEHARRKGFDDFLCLDARRRGFWSGVIYPFVCQHIGVQSIVRPAYRWESREGGRVGYHVVPPFAMSDQVRNFLRPGERPENLSDTAVSQRPIMVHAEPLLRPVDTIDEATVRGNCRAADSGCFPRKISR